MMYEQNDNNNRQKIYQEKNRNFRAGQYNNLKILPEGFDSRLDQSKHTIRMLKDGSSEVIQSEKQKEKGEEEK